MVQARCRRQVHFFQRKVGPLFGRRGKTGKNKFMKKAMKDYLSDSLQEAKAIRQAMREKKLPLLAECITIKTDKNGTKSNN